MSLDEFQAFDQAVASTATIVKGVRPEQMAAPTPCTEWDVRALLNHLTGTLWLASGLFADRPVEGAIGPGELPSTDLVGDDPAASYAEAASAALASAGGEGALTSPHQSPLGEMPGPVLAGFTTLDIFVHGWDLARATGQDHALDAELAEHLLAFSQQMFGGGGRGPVIGPEVLAAEDASTVERLVAYLGRTP